MFNEEPSHACSSFATVLDLPHPGPQRINWPWALKEPTAERDWKGPIPRVTVVTPSYNQGRFLEETIRSVLLQGFPNLEYIIMDGGSTDESVEIIRRYERWIAFWCSEPDDGPEGAINKGFQRATGEIVAWIGADDLLEAGAVWAAVQALSTNTKAGFVYGMVPSIDAKGKEVGLKRSGPPNAEALLRSIYFGAPGVFIRRGCLERVGYLREDLLASDWELWLRLYFVGGWEGAYLERTMGMGREWGGCRSLNDRARYHQDQRNVLEEMLRQGWIRGRLVRRARRAMACAGLNSACHHWHSGRRRDALENYYRALLDSPRGFVRWHLGQCRQKAQSILTLKTRTRS